jgi:hypothetical protein
LRKGRTTYAKTFAKRCNRVCITFGKGNATKPEAFGKGNPTFEKGVAKKWKRKATWNRRRESSFTSEKGSCKWRESCLPSKQGEELQPQAHKQKEL